MIGRGLLEDLRAAGLPALGMLQYPGLSALLMVLSAVLPYVWALFSSLVPCSSVHTVTLVCKPFDYETEHLVDFIMADIVKTYGSLVKKVRANGSRFKVVISKFDYYFTMKTEFKLANGSDVMLPNGVRVSYTESDLPRKRNTRNTRRSRYDEEDEEEDDDFMQNKRNVIRTLTLSARGRGAHALLQQTLDAYQSEMRSRDEKRYHESVSHQFIYRPRINPEGLVEFQQYALAKGYRLTHTTSPSLDKIEAHLQMMDGALQTHSSSSSVPPRSSMGVILHGPGGTGKTTWVKALACRTGRHIVVLNLSLYYDNADALEDLILNGTLLTKEGEEELPLNKLIFFIDECDKYERVLKKPLNDMKTRVSTPAFKTNSERKQFLTDEKRALTHHSLLEMLDGICDAQGRIIVCCTNDLNCMAATVRRSGRLGDHVLNMGYMDAARTRSFFLEKYGPDAFNVTDALWLALEHELDTRPHRLTISKTALVTHLISPSSSCVIDMRVVTERIRELMYDSATEDEYVKHNEDDSTVAGSVTSITESISDANED